ncbi:30S ribosomal protein S21 [candidate division WOR-3 bacterium]|nr:30S ribosomal protein S21 [candidate division WOR-3 bacterium]
MIVERVRDNETFESAYRRFKRECEREQLFAELKRHEYYEKPSVRKKTIKPKLKRY